MLLLCFLVGWLLGSFPAAYLLVKHRHGLDIRAVGSTNVGATNAYESTGSRRTGLAVLLLDALKGIVAAVAGWALLRVLGGDLPFWSEAAFWPKGLALLGAVLGHNYNVFLSFRARRLSGGKGFATAAAGFLLIMPWLVPIWLGLQWAGIRGFEAWKGVRDLIPGNVLATVLVPLAALGIYGWDGLLVTAAFALLVLPKHTRQMRALWRTPYGVHPEPGPVKQALGRKP